MNEIALLALFVLAFSFVVGGLRRRGALAMGLALGTATTVLVAFGLFSGWGGVFWLDRIDLADRFWALLGATALAMLVASAFEVALVAFVTWPWRHAVSRARRIGMLVAAAAGALWGLASWSLIHRWLTGISAGSLEPMIGPEARVPSFMLPLVDALFSLLLLGMLVGLSVATWSTRSQRLAERDPTLPKPHGMLQPQRP